MFKAPNDAETYINQIFDRSNEFIRHNIWEGFDTVDLKSWFNNFKTPDERYFGACILDSLIVRSKKQTISLAFELFTRKLPQLLNSKGFSFNDTKALLEYLSRFNDRIRLVKVENVKDRSGKSYEIIFRLYRRHLGILNDCCITPDLIDSEIRNGIDTFIFIDDILCTGDQFTAMYKSRGLGQTLKNQTVIYAPLVAHWKGIYKLNMLDESISVVYSEYLDDELNSFDFDDDTNNIEDVKEFYLNLLNKYKFNIPADENKFGYGGLALTYLFEHSTPDNNLNIIWGSTKDWIPLTKR